MDWRDALWAKFYTEAPRRQRRSVERYSIVKRAWRTLAMAVAGVNPKTILKWRKRSSVADLPTGPREPKSSVLAVEDEAIIVALRRHTLLPLDDCLYALQATIPHLTRSSLHRCLQRHGISRLPEASKATRPLARRSSSPTRSASFTSTSPKSGPKKPGKAPSVRRHRQNSRNSLSVQLHEQADRRTAYSLSSKRADRRDALSLAYDLHRRQRDPIRRLASATATKLDGALSGAPASTRFAA